MGAREGEGPMWELAIAGDEIAAVSVSARRLYRRLAPAPTGSDRLVRCEDPLYAHTIEHGIDQRREQAHALAPVQAVQHSMHMRM